MRAPFLCDGGSGSCATCNFFLSVTVQSFSFLLTEDHTKQLWADASLPVMPVSPGRWQLLPAVTSPQIEQADMGQNNLAKKKLPQICTIIYFMNVTCLLDVNKNMVVFCSGWVGVF